MDLMVNLVRKEGADQSLTLEIPRLKARFSYAANAAVLASGRFLEHGVSPAQTVQRFALVLHFKKTIADKLGLAHPSWAIWKDSEGRAWPEAKRLMIQSEVRGMPDVTPWGWSEV